MSHANTQRLSPEVSMMRSITNRFAGWGLALVVAALPALVSAAPVRFPSAEAAADAFVDAVARSDGEAMRRILGPNYKKVLQLDEVKQDDKLDFLEAWAKTHRVTPRGDKAAVLEVGETNWSLPIPIVKSGDAWIFDVPAGADEMRTRRIGRNELAAMEAVLAYFDAQKEYAQQERVPGQGRAYAQRLRSTPSKKDGLYWDTAPGEPVSPIGPAYDVLDREGAYHGYYFRILTGQGPSASGGAYDYRNLGRMNAGFALIAWPAHYGDSGIMTFMVNHDGVVFEKNLGPNTDAVVRQIRRFDPDAGWTAVVPASALAAGSTKK